MDEHDYDPVLDSRYNCDKCEDSGIDIDTREYCECRKGLERCNSDKFSDMLKEAPYKEAMYTMNQATMKSERAIAAAEMALLKHRIAGLERELAEVRKDSARYKWLANRVLACDYGDNDSEVIGWRIMGDICDDYPFMYGDSIDNAIDAEIAAASVAQANKEPKE